MVAFLSGGEVGPYDLGIPGPTPYDSYLTPVREVMRRPTRQPNSIEEIGRWMKVANAFTYAETDPFHWQTSAETASLQAGDCKAKSLWLAWQLSNRGMRYVIGKVRWNAPVKHAWLWWNDGNEWWILDPTNCSWPIRASLVTESEWVPYYSIANGVTYRHRAAGPAMRDIVRRPQAVARKAENDAPARYPAIIQFRKPVIDATWQAK